MKKNRLTGLLLGISLVLLLGGGVALAALAIDVEPYCNVCCEYCREPWTCDPWAVTSSGWTPGDWLDVILTSPGPWGSASWLDYLPADAGGKVSFDVCIMCPECWQVAQPQGVPDYLVAWGDWQPGDYGEWTVKVGVGAQTVTGQLQFAEDPADCLVEEFVPEPGTMMLLGSGLAGLAGYAALRLRSERAL